MELRRIINKSESTGAIINQLEPTKPKRGKMAEFSFDVDHETYEKLLSIATKLNTTVDDLATAIIGAKANGNITHINQNTEPLTEEALEESRTLLANSHLLKRKYFE